MNTLVAGKSIIQISKERTDKMVSISNAHSAIPNEPTLLTHDKIKNAQKQLPPTIKTIQMAQNKRKWQAKQKRTQI